MDMTSKGRRVCRIHIDSAHIQCRTKSVFSMTGACEGPSAARALTEWLWGGVGAARGKLEGPEKANTGDGVGRVGRWYG